MLEKGLWLAGGQGAGKWFETIIQFLMESLLMNWVLSTWVDENNHRVMRWFKDANEGSVVVGGNTSGTQTNQLSVPSDLSFDRENNLYVLDRGNCSVQKFSIEPN